MSPSAEDSSHREFDACVDKVISEFFESGRLESGISSIAAADDVGGARGSKVPERVGPYEVVELIGRGGLGTILRVRDATLDREIAVKILHDRHLGKPAVVEQFVAEARVTSALQHPGIVPIHEVGETDDGAPYFAMKIIEGETLAAMLDARDAPDEKRRRFLRIFENVCETIAFAHDRGVVHRDVKPANIMVGAFGEVQVLDWGFASPSGGPREHAEYGHEPGSVRIFGTPSYMAPEQARGEIETVDPRADVFALGAMLCEILTGAPPYLADTRQEIYFKACKAWLDDARKRLSASGADPKLVALTQRCLSPDRDRRPTDAGAVAREVDDYLASLDQRARELEIEAAEARAKAVSERRARRMTLALAAVVLVAGAGYGWWRIDRESRVAAHHQKVSRALDRITMLAEQARTGSAADPDGWRAVVTGAEQALPFSADAELPAELRGRAEELLGRVRAELEQAEKDRRFLDWFSGPRRELARDVLAGDLRSQYARAFGEWGVNLEELTEADAANAVRRSAIAGQAIEAVDDYAVTVRTSSGNEEMSSLWRKLLRIAIQADGDRWRNRVRQAYHDADGERLLQLAQSPDLPTASSDAQLLLSASLKRLGRYDEALDVLRQALARHPDDYRLVHDLERLLWERGAPTEEILWLSLQGVTLRPKSSHAWLHLANALRLSGDERMSTAAFRRVRELDPEFAESGSLAGLLGRQLLAQGFLAEAASQFRHVIANDPSAHGAHFQLARTLVKIHQTDEAIAIYRELLEDHDAAPTRCNLGLALSQAGQFEAAVAELGRGHELGTESGHWPYDSKHWLELVETFRRMGAQIDAHGASAAVESPEERAILATVAVRRDRPWTALRLFRSAFAAEPDLGRNCARVAHPHGLCFRTWAALTAVRAATATLGESAQLPAETRRDCLRQALAWLTAELPALETVAREKGNRVIVRRALSRLRHAPEFAPVRPNEGLEQNVPPKDLPQWQDFWEEVERRYRAKDPK